MRWSVKSSRVLLLTQIKNSADLSDRLLSAMRTGIALPCDPARNWHSSQAYQTVTAACSTMNEHGVRFRIHAKLFSTLSFGFRVKYASYDGLVVFTRNYVPLQRDIERTD